MPPQRLAARASNSEDSHQSQSEAAADDPGSHPDEEAGVLDVAAERGPANGSRLVLQSCLYAKDSEKLAVWFSWKTAVGVFNCRLVPVASGIQWDHILGW